MKKIFCDLCKKQIEIDMVNIGNVININIPSTYYFEYSKKDLCIECSNRINIAAKKEIDIIQKEFNK